MWPSPKLRSPGVSMIQPPPGSGSATAEDEVCLPRPVTGLTVPTARSASGTSRLTSVDLPTPECPTSTLIRPASSPRSSASHPLGQRPAEHQVAQPERRVDRQDRLGPGQVGLGQAEQRLEPGVVGGDQEPVDQPQPGRRVGERADDHELVGVRHDDPFDRVGVIGRAAQRAARAAAILTTRASVPGGT